MPMSTWLTPPQAQGRAQMWRPGCMAAACALAPCADGRCGRLAATNVLSSWVIRWSSCGGAVTKHDRWLAMEARTCLAM